MFCDPVYTLMSLRPEYFAAILDGSKRYEYRTMYRSTPTTAFIYLSRTVRQIGAIIEFGTPVSGSASEIAALGEQQQPGSYNNLMSYFKRGRGCALPVLSVRHLQPVGLQELRDRFPGFCAPQSWYLLDNKPALLEYLLSLPQK